MSRRARLFGAAALTAATWPAAGVRAGDIDAEVPIEEAITVTGERRPYLGTTPLRELPQIVQTLSSATLQDAGITGLQGAMDFVAGVSRQNNFGGLFDSYAIRGFVGDENLASNYLLNGFAASRGYGGARDVSNIERIEVIKGPTSALFGRGDPGGTVNIVTKKADLARTGGAFALSGGSFDNRRVQGDLNIVLADGIAARVTGAYDEGDSFRDHVHHRTYTFTPSFLWKIDGATSLTYELEYVRQAVPFDRGIVAVNGDVRALPRSRFLEEPGDGDIVTGALGHQAQLRHDFGGDWTVLTGLSYRTSTFAGFSSEAENTASRQRLYRDGRTLSRQRRYRDYGTRDMTFRGEASGSIATFGLVHHVQIGADWNYFTLDQRQDRFRPPAIASQTTLARGHAIDVFDPVYGDAPATTAFIDSTEDDESAGVYLQDMIDVADWLKLRAGGRYDDFGQVIHDRMTRRITHQNRTAFSPQVGVSVLPVPAVTLYASYSRGFRPNTGFDVDNRAFAPERTRAYEMGGKLSALHGALTGSLALFSMTKTNVLTADPVNAGFSVAVGKARSRGIEAALTGTLPWGVRVDLGYAHTDAEVARDAIDPNFGYSLRKGDPLINVAKNSASALMFKDFAVSGRKADIGVGVNHVGRRLGETGYRDAGGNLFTLPAYTLVRVMASLAPTERLRVSGEITNLFDVAYMPSSYSRVWLMPGAPRQFTIRLGYTF